MYCISSLNYLVNYVELLLMHRSANVNIPERNNTVNFRCGFSS
jgi:hypothetical protein